MVQVTAGLDAERRAARGFDPAHAATLLAVFVITLLASGPFAEGLFSGAQTDQFQQAIVELFWITIFALALPALRLDRIPWDRRIGVVVAFVFWATLSSLWAGGAAMLKGAVLTFNVAAVFLLAATRPFGAIVDAMIAALALLAAISLVLVAFFPEIALVDTEQHAGQWTGVFDNKQTLGIDCAFLLYLAAMRIGEHRGWPAIVYHLATMAAAVVCIVGAGSRGGGVLAVLAVALGFLSRRSLGVARLAGYAPLATLAISATMMAALVVTDRDFLTIAGFDIDFTERAKIWKHALDYFGGGTTVFGWGLNGFWSRKDIADAFIGGHEWYLDNFHNGFLAVLVECGLIGMGLFVGLTLALPSLMAGGDRDREHETTTILGFMVLFYVIDLTETFFLRSTNTFSMIFFYFVFRLFVVDRPTPTAT
ncbi:MAG: O-antigen ligase family protein [Hyphomicrobiales bacterium]|nr:O-antigen ligase family protein [Hyphomicrobiales bacterium]